MLKMPKTLRNAQHVQKCSKWLSSQMDLEMVRYHTLRFILA